MATFSWDVKRFRVFLGMGESPLDVVAYSSRRFVPFQLKQNRIAAEFPDVPHRYCDNHFLRDVAKPVLEADSHAKVQMRAKVRGLRKIEQAVLQRQKAETKDDLTPDTPEAIVTATAAAATLSPAVVDPAGSV